MLQEAQKRCKKPLPHIRCMIGSRLRHREVPGDIPKVTQLEEYNWDTVWPSVPTSTALAACRAYLCATLVPVPTWTGVSKPGPGGAISAQWLAASSVTGLAVLGRKAVAVQSASPFPAQMVAKGLCKCFMLATVPTLLEGCQNLLEPARAQCLWLCPALSGEREYTHGLCSAPVGSRVSPTQLL